MLRLPIRILVIAELELLARTVIPEVPAVSRAPSAWKKVSAALHLLGVVKYVSEESENW